MEKKIDLLIDLLRIDSMSGNEVKIGKFLMGELKKLGFDAQQDAVGNIYAVRGDAKSYPLLNCHMDTVDIDYSFGYGNNYRYNRGRGLVYGWNDDDDDDVNEEHIEAYRLIQELGVENWRQIFKCKDCEYNMRCLNEIEVCNCFEPTSECLEAIVRESKERNEKETDDEGEQIDVEKLDDVPFMFGLNTDVKSKDKGKSKKKSSKTKYVSWKKDFKITIEKGKIRGVEGSNRVLGGDDKCGLFVALSVARELKDAPMKILFTVMEEEGLVGVQSFIKSHTYWFEDVSYCLTLDRRSNSDLLWSQLGTRSCTNKFAGQLAKVGISLGIPVQIQDGNSADVVKIRDLVPNAVNMSVGYYNAHTDSEFIVIKDVLNSVKWVMGILKKVK